jgi:DNA-binding XRE family transcriptional regulator
MKKTRKDRLQSAGWKIGSTAEFLDLSPDEVAFIEVKLALAQSLKQRRQKKRLTQSQLAKLLKSSQSRIAKMEAADPTVSIDLLIRSLLALGASTKELAKVIE